MKKRIIPLLFIAVFFTVISCQETPVPLFSTDITEAVPGEIITFTNSTTDAFSYVWDFGDGETSELAEPTHAYTDLGTYTVKLTAYSENEKKSAEATYTITVVELENAVISSGIRYEITNVTTYYYDETLADDYYLIFGDGDYLTCSECIHDDYHVGAFAHIWASSLTEIPTGTYLYKEDETNETFSWGFFGTKVHCNPDSSELILCTGGTVKVVSSGDDYYAFELNYNLENGETAKLHYEGLVDFHQHNYGDGTVCIYNKK